MIAASLNHFGLLDYIIFAIYLLASLLVGVVFVKEQKDIKSYFLAGQSMGYVVVGISVLAALFSLKDEDELIRIATIEKEPMLRARARMQLRLLATPKALKFLTEHP